MRVRRAALLVISGAVMLPSMVALAVWMVMRSGTSRDGYGNAISIANANLMFFIYLLLAILCTLWICAVGWGRVDPE